MSEAQPGTAAADDLRVIGIMLVHNEDRFLRRAAINVLGFCDRLLIAEHLSTDGTLEIAQELARQHPKVELHRIRRPEESHQLLAPYVNSRTWVFGVDGDEIYDPAGLQWTRAQLASGVWDEHWVVFGNVLNCTALDDAASTAQGYLAPPCRSMTKLYNFNAITALDPKAPQRLMGRRDAFKPGYDMLKRFDLYKELTWEQAHFRCLHACFLPRSSADSAAGGRENLTELKKHSPFAWLRRMAATVLGRSAASRYKDDKYKRGPLATVNAAPFFPDIQ